MISNFSLGGRSVDRLRKLVGLFQTFWKSNTTDGSILFIACPAASGDVAADDTLDRQHLKLFTHHGFAFVFGLLEKFRHIFYINRDHMVRKNILGHVEPELGHLGQDSTFFCHFIMKDHIKTADAICGNHDQTVAIIIDLTYFTFFDRF